MSATCLIVEDEPLARERLVGYIARLPFLTLVGELDSAVDALALLRRERVDLVFLDISMSGMSGIELLETSVVTSQVILTTAHADYAVKAYDLKVADYLLKPFGFERFVQAVDRALGGSTEPDPAPERPYLFIKTESRLERVSLDDVLFIEGKGDYRRIHTTTKRIMTLQTFGDLETKLPADRFCRVHKSYLVSLAKIESVERDRIVIRDQLIPISDTYRERFYSLIGRRTD